MKMIMKRLGMFLVLMLVLSAGLSYLSLDKTPVDKDTKNIQDAQRMSIALVNEDKGAAFNNQKLAFGDAFVKSMDKNNNHDWYVVSRGVAESGLKRSTYDMMVVIPSDFSQKALSIDTDSPDQVVLNYKINASENAQVQAQAEKTASTILNEFNRRIIDVYFASIMGNLQDAQDRIRTIVNKEAHYTNIYNQSVHNPLANYTNQFGNVKSHTNVLKDNFGSLEDTLHQFEDNLTSGASDSKQYVSNIDETQALLEKDNALTMSFSDELQQLQSSLNHQDVEQELQQLQFANKMINNQFQDIQFADNRRETILTGAVALKANIEQALTGIDSVQQELDQRLDNDNLNEEVHQKLLKVLGEAFHENDELRTLFDSRDEKSKAYMEQQIAALPSLNESEFGGYGLPQQTVNEIKNVIAVTNKYNQEIEQVESNTDNGQILAHHIMELKQHLSVDGIQMEDAVEIPENKKSGQVFTLNIPDDYTVKTVALTLPGQGTKDYTQTYLENHRVVLPANSKGIFTVNVRLQLKDMNHDIDVYQPAKWSWDLQQVDITDAENTTVTPPGNTKTKHTGEKTASKQKQQQTSTQKTAANQEETKSKNENNETITSENKKQEKPEANSNENAATDDSAKTDASEPPAADDSNDGNSQDQTTENQEPVKVNVLNNRIHHVVMSPVTDEETSDLIQTIIHTISPYQKLLAAYESYFGLQMESGDLRNYLNEKSLIEWGKESKTSLYYLFNEINIGELLVDQVTAGIVHEIQEPLRTLYDQMDVYRDTVHTSKENAEKLMENVIATNEQAKRMNENLGNMLDRVAEWRHKNVQLLDQQAAILTTREDESGRVMQLSREYQPLLMQSQGLADQAENNLHVAKQVYQTFDNIDEQATTIQNSGTDLIDRAEILAVNMTNKLADDQEFADNFSDVFANSRIGDRQNEDLYDFLSNPVQTENKETIVAGDTASTPYFLVLICFIIALFSAYVISTINHRQINSDPFSTGQSLLQRNSFMTVLTAGIGLIEGIIIGVLSGYFLHVSGGILLIWTGMLVLTMLAMVLIAAYLLRQLKMIGMFLLLVVLSLYLISADALGSAFAGARSMQLYSPLNYVESFLMDISQRPVQHLLPVIVMAAVIGLGAAGNLFVLNHGGKKELKDEELDEKAN